MVNAHEVEGGKKDGNGTRGVAASAAVSATALAGRGAVAETAGSAGGVSGSARGVRQGRSTEGGESKPSPPSHGLASRDGERGKSALPCVLANTETMLAKLRSL